MGRFRDASDPQLALVRQFPVREFSSYLVLYRVTDEAVEVLRVLHGARDISTALRESE